MVEMVRNKPHFLVGILFFVALILSIVFGAVSIPPGMIARILLNRVPGVNISSTWPGSYEAIVWMVRFPHTILIAIAGAALAGSGAAYQGLFRNPLADPYLIGVASGAGLGAVSAMSIRGTGDQLGLFLIPIGAFLGALVTVFSVYALARVGRMVPLTTLILAGVAIGTFASALTSFIMLRSDDQIYRAISFLLGGSTMSGWKPVLAIIPYMILGMGLLILSGHILNVMQFGDEQANQLGLPVEKAKIFVIITASLTTAVAVAFSGVIGFVGLIVPHMVRIIWGADYRRLIPLAILGGASTLLLADVIARILMAPQTLPVGIVTALAGTPFFLWILRRAKTEVFW